jgi:transposase
MSKKRFELLSEAQWELIAPLLPEPKRRKDKRGRPWASNRACLEGILWVLQTGAAWRFLPDKYPSPATCWRRLKQWEEQDVWLDAWRALLGALDGEGLLKWEETFLDGSFAPAKKGAPPSVKPSAARGRSGWYWLTVAVFRWEFVGQTRHRPHRSVPQKQQAPTLPRRAQTQTLQAAMDHRTNQRMARAVPQTPRTP